MPADLVDVNFESFSTKAAMLAAGAPWDKGAEKRIDAMRLDKTVAPPGGTRSMRYDYNHGANPCSSITIRRGVKFPAQQEVVVQHVVRFSPNWLNGGPCTGPYDFKLIFGDTEDDMSYRWGLHWGMHQGDQIGFDYPLGDWAGGSAPTVRPDVRITKLLGIWFPLTQRIRHSTTPASKDARWRVWVGSTLIHDAAGFNTWKVDATKPEFINGFGFGHNKDKGPANTTMSLWWGPVRVWSAAAAPAWTN